MKDISDFALECYSMSNKELFKKCLELFKKIPQTVELQLINKSLTIEVKTIDSKKDDYLIEEMPYEFYLEEVKKQLSDVVAIVSTLPTELGLYTWEIVTVNKNLVENKLVKVWIVPIALI